MFCYLAHYKDVFVFVPIPWFIYPISPIFIEKKDRLFLLGVAQIRSDVFIQLHCVDRALGEQSGVLWLTGFVGWVQSLP